MVMLWAEPGHTACISACGHLLGPRTTAAPSHMAALVCGTVLAYGEPNMCFLPLISSFPWSGPCQHLLALAVEG